MTLADRLMDSINEIIQASFGDDDFLEVDDRVCLLYTLTINVLDARSE